MLPKNLLAFNFIIKYFSKSKYRREKILRLLLYFPKFMKCDHSFIIQGYPSDSGYYSNARLLPFVLNIVVFLKI